MRINRWINSSVHTGEPPDIETPETPTSNIATVMDCATGLSGNTIQNNGYVVGDFGENAINSHNPSDSGHSEKCQLIFNYVTRNYRNRCTSLQSYNNPTLGNSIVYKEKILEKASLVDADLIYTPYVNSAVFTNGEYNDLVLSVGSHYDNSNTDGDTSNNDRHDIVANINSLIPNTVACSARREVYSEISAETSYGYGMEFFEDLSIEALDLQYPNKDIPIAFAEVTTDETGTVITTSVHLGFANYLSIGNSVYIQNAGTIPNQNVQVTEVIDGNTIRVNQSVGHITQSGIYLFGYATLANYCGAQRESWAVPLIAGKLKIIRLETGASWDEVRLAARITAKRKPMGVPELDNVNWDIYRGFGVIDVQGAINYINNN